MTDQTSGIVFPAFNAKLMQDHEVVNSFVHSDLFNPAVAVSHTLIMGPRGSGKTTLLKMLSVNYLRRWSHPKADLWRNSAKFNGIFLPADIVWAEAARDNMSQKLDDFASQRYIESLFCTSMLIAALNAFETKVRKESDLETPEYGFYPARSECVESAISSLSKLWLLNTREITFNGLRNSVLARLLLLQTTVREIKSNARIEIDRLKEMLPFVTLDPHGTLEASVTVFDSHIGHSAGLWALLVDEMEIVPPEIQRTILNRFRSGSQKLIYKVAVVPCTQEVDSTLNAMMQASPKNDFQRVSLWYSKKNQSKKFSNELFSAWLKRKGLDSSTTPIQLLGSSQIGDEDEDEDTQVDPSSSERRKIDEIFSSLKDKDPSFNAYIERRKIDVTDLKSQSNAPLKNEIRKIKPTVAMREALFRDGGSVEAALTSKKSMAEFYSGWQAIASICEGNPRWLNAYLSGLYSESWESDGIRKIPQATQAHEVKKCADAYVAMLSSIAKKDPMAGFSTDQNVYQLLDSIGQQFKNILYRKPFSIEPALSFYVDADVTVDQEAALKIALNHGAIVYADEIRSGTADFQSLKGKRFRLTFLLATYYSLILRLHKGIPLSSLLSDKESNTPESHSLEKTPSTPTDQGTLDFS